MVSVIISTYDKWDFLRLTLAHFLLQSESRFELVIVNDGGDPLSRRIEPFKERLDIKLVETPSNNGLAAARNTAVDVASGDILLFSDDDRIPCHTLVERHARTGQDDVLIGLKKRVLTIYEPGRTALWPPDVERLTALSVQRGCSIDLERPFVALHLDASLLPDRPLDELLELPERSNPSSLTDDDGNFDPTFRFPWAFATTANMSLHRHAFSAVGGFDPAYRTWGHEDVDLSYRLHKSGMRFVYDKAAINLHQVHPLGPDDFTTAYLQQRSSLRSNSHRFVDKFDDLPTLLYAAMGISRIEEAQRLLDACLYSKDPLHRNRLCKDLRALIDDAE